MTALGVVCLLWVLVLGNCEIIPEPAGPIRFQCTTQLPMDTSSSEKLQPSDFATTPFVIKTYPTTGFYLGEDIQVDIAMKEGSNLYFKAFILQAQVAAHNSEVGTFTPSDTSSRPYNCTDDDDTLVNSGTNILEGITATWTPPSGMTTGTTIEFDATVMATDGRFWMIRSVLIRFQENPNESRPDDTEGSRPDGVHGGEEEEEKTGPVDDFEQPRKGNPGDGDPDETGEDPNEAERIAEEEREESLRRDREGEALDDAELTVDHGLKTEEELYLKFLEYQRLLEDEENQGGEADAAILRRLEEEKHQHEIDEERQESERLQAEEENARLERIRMEIIDKEEYDAEMARKEAESSDEIDMDSDEDVIGDGSAGVCVVRSLGVLSAIVVAAITLFL